MNDGWAVAMAVATAVGAWARLPVPRWLGAVVVVVALVARRPALLCVGAALLAAALSVAAWAGTAPVRAAPFDGVVTLVDRPRAVGRAACGPRSGPGPATSRRGPTARRPPRSAPGRPGERLAVVGTTGPGAEQRPAAPGRAAHRRAAAGPARRGPRRRRSGEPRRQPGAAGPRRRRLAAVAGRAGAVHRLRAGRRPGRAARPGRRLPRRRPQPPHGRLRGEPGLRVGAGRAAAAPPDPALAVRRDRRPGRLVRPADPVRAVGAAGLRHGRARRDWPWCWPARPAPCACSPWRSAFWSWSIRCWSGRSAGGCRSAPPPASPCSPLRWRPGSPGPGRWPRRWPSPSPPRSAWRRCRSGCSAACRWRRSRPTCWRCRWPDPLMVWGLPAGVVAGLVPAAAPVLHLPTRLAVRWIALVARTAAAAPLGQLGWPHLAVAAGLGAVAATVRAAYAGEPPVVPEKHLRVTGIAVASRRRRRLLQAAIREGMTSCRSTRSGRVTAAPPVRTGPGTARCGLPPWSWPAPCRCGSCARRWAPCTATWVASPASTSGGWPPSSAARRSPSWRRGSWPGWPCVPTAGSTSPSPSSPATPPATWCPPGGRSAPPCSSASCCRRASR